MPRTRAVILVAVWAALAGIAATRGVLVSALAAPADSDLMGSWVGTVEYGGETSQVGLLVEEGPKGPRARWSTPAVHAWDFPIGAVSLDGTTAHIGPAVLAFDPGAGTLSGVIPAALAPVHTLRVTFRRGALPHPPRPEPAARRAEPRWTVDTGSPIWADTVAAHGLVYAGNDAGELRAVDAHDGNSVWTFRTGGQIRCGVTVAGNDLFVSSDDGFVYRLDAATGRERWRTKIVDKPIHRLPYVESPRGDYRASGVAISKGRLFVGTFDGHVRALDAERGTPLWDFAAQDSVLATPAVASDAVYFGSFDGNVYAVAVASGALRWKHDTGAPINSAPAIDEGRILIGSRSYDLLALEAGSGAVAWSRYFWFSWVESAATVRDGTAYIGSSDAAAVSAFDSATGKTRWATDVLGSAWGQPAVTGDRLFIGTAGTQHYLADHQGGVLALERRTGKVMWTYRAAAPAESHAFTTYGFAGSPAIGQGLVYIGGIDGKLYAFPQ